MENLNLLGAGVSGNISAGKLPNCLG